MATCKFCGREFDNAQAVRAHLKSCAPYQEHRASRPEQESGSPRQPRLRQPDPRGGSLGRPSADDSLGSIPPAYPGPSETNGFDPVRQLDQEIAMEQRRIKLRELHDSQDELDRRAKTLEQERQREADREAETKRAAEREQLALRQQAMDAQRLQDERARTKQQREQRRREAIQDTKREVVDHWLPMAFVSSDLRAQILIEIERTLSALPVEDLPMDELVRIAAGVRDRLCDEAKRAEQAARQRTVELNRRCGQLKQHGMEYAKRELSDVEGLSSLTARSIEQRIARALDDITGDESTDDIEDLVEDILEHEGIGYEDDDDD